MDRINPALGIVGNQSLIYVLRFSGSKRIEADEFCDQAQQILYDDLGSIGHFRVAPAKRENLNENFILSGKPDHSGQYISREDNEIFVSFIIREGSACNPISTELSIIPKELKQFCEAAELSVEQMDVRSLYA
ncbi:hypothetical protein [Marinobacter sp.]|uniref:hypothetical protein n=1 Tax=Marinobacter sp. TaxID=50741 RepID=UPI003562AC00